MAKIKNPTITANPDAVEIHGSKLDIKLALSGILLGLQQRNVLTKEELQEMIDMVFMDKDELADYATKKFAELLKNLGKKEKE